MTPPRRTLVLTTDGKVAVAFSQGSAANPGPQPSTEAAVSQPRPPDAPDREGDGDNPLVPVVPGPSSPSTALPSVNNGGTAKPGSMLPLPTDMLPGGKASTKRKCTKLNAGEEFERRNALPTGKKKRAPGNESIDEEDLIVPSTAKRSGTVSHAAVAKPKKRDEAVIDLDDDLGSDDESDWGTSSEEGDGGVSGLLKNPTPTSDAHASAARATPMDESSKKGGRKRERSVSRKKANNRRSSPSRSRSRKDDRRTTYRSRSRDKSRPKADDRSRSRDARHHKRGERSRSRSTRRHGRTEKSRARSTSRSVSRKDRRRKHSRSRSRSRSRTRSRSRSRDRSRSRSRSRRAAKRDRSRSVSRDKSRSRSRRHRSRSRRRDHSRRRDSSRRRQYVRFTSPPRWVNESLQFNGDEWSPINIRSLKALPAYERETRLVSAMEVAADRAHPQFRSGQFTYLTAQRASFDLITRNARTLITAKNRDQKWYDDVAGFCIDFLVLLITIHYRLDAESKLVTGATSCVQVSRLAEKFRKKDVRDAHAYWAEKYKTILGKVADAQKRFGSGDKGGKDRRHPKGKSAAKKKSE